MLAFEHFLRPPGFGSTHITYSNCAVSGTVWFFFYTCVSSGFKAAIALALDWALRFTGFGENCIERDSWTTEKKDL